MDIEEKQRRADHDFVYDSLTGLYNLDTFKRCVASFLEKQEKSEKFALLYTDITHFERVNNLYGTGRDRKSVV